MNTVNQQQRKDRQASPRISRISESTFTIETPELGVGITTAGGLRIWGTEETTVSFSFPRPRLSGLPKQLEAMGGPEECASVYSAVFDRELYVPKIVLHETLPAAEDAEEASAWIRLDLLQLPEGPSLATATLFIPPEQPHSPDRRIGREETS